MKYSVYSICLLSLLPNMLFASDNSAMNKYLSKIAIFEEGNGRKIKSFEDVKLKFNPFQERNKEYPIVNENEIPEGYVNKKTANKYFKQFSSHAVLTDSNTSFQDFMNEHFYLDSNATGDGVDIMKTFPVTLWAYFPWKKRFYLKMDDEYKFISKFNKFEPDALSCSDCASLCEKKCSSSHIYGAKNIYSNFKSNLMDNSEVIDAEDIDNPDNYIEFELVNRTPPSIPNGFVALGRKPETVDRYTTDSFYYSTTGDWFMTEYIEVAKKASELNYVKFAFGRINECPQDGQNWQDYEKWDNLENVIEVATNTVPQENGELIEKYSFRDLVKFYPFNGILRYSIFVKEGEAEGNGNLNPGVEKVIEDEPLLCYGYKAGGNLGDELYNAKDWPDKRKLSEVNEMGQDTGTIRIYDDDRPNIIIRITNTETGAQLFFPPCPSAKECVITNSSKYKALVGNKGTNQDDYKYFVGESLNPIYDCNVILENPSFKPFYTLFSINDIDVTNSTKDTNIERLLQNKDLEFINKNTRVEDYFYSDKSKDGNLTFKAENGELGKRLGTFKNMVALIENRGEFRFKTGVEYKLDVWTDDNVKWTNIDEDNKKQLIINPETKNGEGRANYGATKDKDGNILFFEPDILKYAKVYHTGIKQGKIILSIPNSSDENLDEEKDIDITKAINGGIYFTLKDETVPKYDLVTVEELDENNFPSITVKVKDFAENSRELKLYFRVNDNNIEIRTLDKKTNK